MSTGERQDKSTAQRAAEYLVGLGQGYHQVTAKAKTTIVVYLAERNRPIAKGSFDLIKLPQQRESPVDRLTPDDLQHMVLIELKSSSRDLGEDLRDFFFSFQAAQQAAAQKLGDSYRIAFVVFRPRPKGPFHEVMSWSDIWRHARKIYPGWSVQF